MRRTGNPSTITITVHGSVSGSPGARGGVTVPTLRHTFASRLVQSGVDLYRVGTLLGHTTLATTARYAHLSDQSLVDSVLMIER